MCHRRARNGGGARCAGGGRSVSDYCAHNHALQSDHYRRQLYSPTDGRTLPDRFVLGTCPRCGHPDARGDQCDGCGQLLDPTDLRHPRSALSGCRHLQLRATEHAFLTLSQLQPRLRRYVDEHAPTWSPVARAAAEAGLSVGLQDRCITRDLDWGVPVPDLPGRVFWCWFDAPIAYASLAPSGWWREDVAVTHFLGKDNAWFHTLWLPAILLGAQDETNNTTAPRRVQALHWLNWYGDKFSTSRRVGIFLDEALQLLPADVWRWGLLAQTPETADSRFAWEQLAAVVNKDLVGQLGNFVRRIQRLCAQQHATVSGSASGEEEAVWRGCRAQVRALEEALEDLRFRDAIGALRALFRIGNRYVDAQAPWSLPPSDARRAVVLRTTRALVRLYASAVAEVMPCTSRTLFDAVAAGETERTALPEALLGDDGLVGRAVREQPPLFARVPAEVPDS